MARIILPPILAWQEDIMPTIYINPYIHGGAAGASTTLYTVTTTGAQTHNIASLGVSAATTVYWGDGNSDIYTGTAARSHAYAGAGTWVVSVDEPLYVTTLNLNDNKITLNSADVAAMANVIDFRVYSLKAGTFDSADVSAWRPSSFHLHSMPTGYAGTFDSADVSAWRPAYFHLYSMPTGYAGTFDSADVSAWRPAYFYLHSMPTGYAGTFDSADVSAWRPAVFQLHVMPAGYAGTFDSADVSAWQPAYFYLHSMPTGYAGTFDSADVSAWQPAYFYLHSMPTGYAGTFDSADVSAWRPAVFRLHVMPAGYAGTFDSADVSAWQPAYFYLYSMPTGYAGTFDSADVSAWRPSSFHLYSMPTGYAGTFDSADVSAWRPAYFYLHSMPAGYAITAGGGFANWSTTVNFYVQNNGLTAGTVDAILWELYQASTVPRTASGGTINISDSNAAPSGTYQAATSCPVTVATPGKEIAHELKNDGCAVGFNKWTTVTTS